MTIGERIAKCRKEKNLSQEYVAELLEVSRQAVSKWETGQSEPDTANLIALARVFGVSVEYLACGEEDSPTVVYVEKNLPVFKILGIVLFALGGISLLLGIIAPFMFGVGIVTIAFGLLLIFFQREGLILGGVIVTLGVILFVIQGIFFGIDGPVLASIAAVSVGLPVLVYAIIKLVKKIREAGAFGKLKNNPVLIRRIILVIIVAAIVVAAIAIPVSIASKRRQSAFEKAKFFSSERLSEYMVEGFPAPADTDCINLNNEKILLHFDKGEDFSKYIRRIYLFLVGKNYTHLGTRGDVICAEGEARTYAFVPYQKGTYNGYSQFSSNETPDDYYFVYSNSIRNEENGEIECCIIELKFVDTSVAVVNGKKYPYNAEMSVYRESIAEGYQYPTYTIEYNKNNYGGRFDLAEEILPNQPTLSLPGKEITVRIKPQSEDIELWIDGGKQIPRTAMTDEYWEYTFTMPAVNIELFLRPKSN